MSIRIVLQKSQKILFTVVLRFVVSLLTAVERFFATQPLTEKQTQWFNSLHSGVPKIPLSWTRPGWSFAVPERLWLARLRYPSS